MPGMLGGEPMTDDKGAGEGLYKHSVYGHATGDLTKCLACAHAAGRKAERERCADICEQNATCEGIAQKIKAHILGGQDGK